MTRKGNGTLPNVHFRKEWQNYVRTWFDQPMRKKRRNTKRVKKARMMAPKPVAGALRPQVTCQTFKYHTKLRAGRGFTLEELKVNIVVIGRSQTHLPRASEIWQASKHSSRWGK